MTKHKNTKGEAILKLIKKGMSNREIRERVEVGSSYLWKLRKEAEAATKSILELAPTMEIKVDPELAYQITSGRQARKANAVQEGGDHYKKMAVEPWDIYDSWPAEQRIGAYRANCVKYILRLESKDSRVLNARKLKHYASKLVEVAEELEK